MIAAAAKKKSKLPAYPADHKLGMKVPEGGSDCAKCEYVSEDEKKCGNSSFVKVEWLGVSAPAR